MSKHFWKNKTEDNCRLTTVVDNFAKSSLFLASSNAVWRFDSRSSLCTKMSGKKEKTSNCEDKEKSPGHVLGSNLSLFLENVHFGSPFLFLIDGFHQQKPIAKDSSVCRWGPADLRWRAWSDCDGE
jgi:hypothetical protein